MKIQGKLARRINLTTVIGAELTDGLQGTFTVAGQPQNISSLSLIMEVSY